MKRTGNSWIDRFDPDISDGALRTRILSQTRRLVDLALMPPSVAIENLRHALGQIFVPTAQHCTILRAWLGAAREYAERHYPSRSEYQRTLYLERIPPRETPPICLTGLSGSGKSALFLAFCRLFGGNQTIDIPNHKGLPLHACWMLRTQERSTLQTLFREQLHGGSEKVLRSDKNMTVEERVRKVLYRDGVCLVLLDELQFIAKVGTAMASNILLSLTRLGPPVVFASNFSLIHRFELRPQEERRRLLNNVIVMEADGSNSSDWKSTFRAMIDVAKEFANLDPNSDGRFIHEHAFGIKGYAAKLLLLAYIAARRSGATAVKRAHLESAYRASDYTLEREDVLELERQSLNKGGKQRHRHDLQCCFQTNTPSSVAEASSLIEKHKTRVSQRMIESSLTASEREETRQKNKENSASDTSKTVPIRRQIKANKETLLAGAKSFRESSARPNRIRA